MALLIFLRLNGKWISMRPLTLYKLAMIVSESLPKEKDEALEEIEKMFKDFITKA